MDIIKLTALFVARNGKQFMNTLAQKEAKNFQFDFLQSNHSLFGYFTKLVEHYTHVLIPKNIEDHLQSNLNKFQTLQEVYDRAEYMKYTSESAKLKLEEEEAERIAFASIDWHDFVVVETIEFTDVDEKMNLPPPMSIQMLQNMTLAQKRAASLFEQEKLQEEKVAKEMEIEKTKPEPVSAILPPPTTKKIRTDYVPKGEFYLTKFLKGEKMN
jgi:splicing factor 3A subunit 1